MKLRFPVFTFRANRPLFLTALLALAFQSRAAVVLNTDDSGAGSLRQAVLDASPGETITFSAGLDGATIPLTSGQVLLNKDLNIDASALASGIIIDGNASGRIFEITATAVFDSLTLTNGKAIGGVPPNSGGAILVGFGANLTLNRCALTKNSAYIGGGIENYQGSVTLNHTTLAGNTASDFGGGVFTLYGTLVLNNSTLTGNTAPYDGGGIYSSSSTLEFNNATVAGNTANNSGGGIYSSGGALKLANSIIAGNTAPTAANIVGSISSNVGSLTSGNPLLAPLGDYGGPTRTLSPLPGSPAIDAGNTFATNSLTDQRGLARVVGAKVDIGAVEYDLATFPENIVVVDTLADDNGSLSDGVSLREAIFSVVEFPPPAIVFAPALSGQTILLTNGQLLVEKSLTIDASALAGGITIDGNGQISSNRVFEIAGNTTCVFDSLTLTNGYGGAVISSYSASGSLSEGGAIFINSGASLALNHSLLQGNSAEFGGAIFIDAGAHLVLNHSTVAGNTASGSVSGDGRGGGGIANGNLFSSVLPTPGGTHGKTAPLPVGRCPGGIETRQAERARAETPPFV